MTSSRKRSRHTSTATGNTVKRLKTGHSGTESTLVEHPTFCLYYHRVLTLRNYLLASLPASSRSRRRLITSVGSYNRYNAGKSRKKSSIGTECPNQDVLDGEICLATLLDNTLVCAVHNEPRMLKESREKDFASFSQQTNLTVGSSTEEGLTTISEV